MSAVDPDRVSALAPDDPRHGKRSGYKQGCREACCRRANSAAQAKRRNRIKDRVVVIPADMEHGKDSTYTNWICRCGPCTQAHTDAWVDWDQNRRKK